MTASSWNPPAPQTPSTIAKCRGAVWVRFADIGAPTVVSKDAADRALLGRVHECVEPQLTHVWLRVIKRRDITCSKEYIHHKTDQTAVVN